MLLLRKTVHITATYILLQMESRRSIVTLRTYFITLELRYTNTRHRDLSAHLLYANHNIGAVLYPHINAAAGQLVTPLLLITKANSGMTNTAHTSSQ